MKSFLLAVLVVSLGMVNFTNALTCYSCTACNDPFSASSNTGNIVTCTGGTCQKTVVAGVVERTCIASGTTCVAVSVPGVGSTSCCSDKDNCNGVDQMKVNASAMIFLALSSVFFYLFK